MLVRVLGIAAVAGGVLRIVDSFTAEIFSPSTLSLLYVVTDALLLLGIAGIYWSRGPRLGIAGTLGAATFALGIIWIRISASVMPGANGYQLGAAISLIGLGLLSVEELLRDRALHPAPIFWLAALLFAIAGAFGVLVSLLTIAAGVAFGAGFVAAGRRVLANATPAVIPAR